MGLRLRTKVWWFIAAFVPLYFLVGVLSNTVGTVICWLPEATAWDRFHEYYLRAWGANLARTALCDALLVACASGVARLVGAARAIGGVGGRGA